MPLGAMFVGVSADGEVSDRVVARFSRLRLESWRGGWAVKPERADDGQWIILEGSPAKAGTGQNLYLPQCEGLLAGVWAGFEPFLSELWCRLEARVPAEQFKRLVYEALSKALVQRLDLTTHIQTLGQDQAIALLRHVDQARGGIYSNRAVRRWNRDGETSLSCGPGRRWGAVLYCKQNEMVVVGHCPRLKAVPALHDEAEGLVRYEYRHRSEMLTLEERNISFWTGARIVCQRAKDFSLIHWPALPPGSAPRYRRRRVGYDCVVSKIAERLEQLARDLGYRRFADLPEPLANSLSLDFRDIYAQQRIIYSLEDIVDYENGAETMGVLERKRDREVLAMWEAGVDVWASIREKPRTSRRIVNNILNATGVDIRARKMGEGVHFESSIAISGWNPVRSWQELLVA